MAAQKAALVAAQIDPAQVGYINAHGTGTPLNDSAETNAIREVFGGRGSAPPVSSSKSMCGHAVAAAGGLEAVLTLLALRDEILPPTINLSEPDPDCDLDYVPNAARDEAVDIALSNSFGFGGVNAALVLGRGEAGG